MEYNFRNIEKKWQDIWKKSGVYNVSNDSPKPKCYVLDMFPYPSGAGLHVGHPLGYIASDIYSRYKRLKGYNVLHPMGYDAFGLPAEQYAIDHGIHPAVSTENNIDNFRRQLDNIGFSFDWDREIRTSDPKYYEWTQWIFLQLFKSFYNRNANKAEPIDKLIKAFEAEGNKSHPVPNSQFQIPLNTHHAPLNTFTSDEWQSFDEKMKQNILMEYRLAYCGYGEVNWCEALGTVLANDEVINGVSERGGYPVVKKRLRQWYLRITEYADRLLNGLNKVDFSEAMKEMQTNWIGKSTGAEIDFRVKIGKSVESQKITYRDSKTRIASVTISDTENDEPLTVYTTRPDTIFGVDFMVIAPEHELVEQITTDEHKQAVDEYIAYVKSRSERERMAEKKITGIFTGAFAVNPFNGREIPIWISEYVLAGYGTGAIMGVPCGDERDHKFARHFNISITNIIGDYYNGEEANPTYDAKLENSDFLNGIEMRKAGEIVIAELELAGLGKRKVNYKMRDAAFSRQRYWGEPFPIVWKNGIAYPLDEKELPLELPHVESYKPGPDGEGPLANIPKWTSRNLETNTMPGYAGSSWYFLRYMDPHNDKAFCDRKVSDYWGQVDIYIGGTEHAVGHLLYSRMWTKALYDLNSIGFDEPYRKLVNQGMIQGVSEIIYRFNVHYDLSNNDISGLVGESRSNTFPYPIVSKGNTTTLTMGERTYAFFFSADAVTEKQIKDMSLIHVPIKYAENNKLDISSLIKEWDDEDLIFVTKGGYLQNGEWYNWDLEKIRPQEFKTIPVVEKMSKRYQNVVNPDDIVMKYGADTFRMYEMFLGPVEMSKPWDTKGIEGVFRFLKKFWRLFYDETKGWQVNHEQPTEEELKVLHRAIKKVEDDTERFSFNTAVSAFMIATNDLTDLKCHKKEILEPLLILLAPYAPHIAEELYYQVISSKVSPPAGGRDLEGAFSILNASYPTFQEKYIKESSKAYPVAINGKTRTELILALDITQQQVEEIVLQNEIVKKWLDGKTPKKIIYVKNKMINVVI